MAGKRETNQEILNGILAIMEDDKVKKYVKHESPRDLEWMHKHHEWIWAHGPIHLDRLDPNDHIAQQFKDLDCIRTHVRQLDVHRFLLVKIWEILIRIGCPEFNLLTRKHLEIHDESKMSVLIAAGYSEKWVLKSKNQLFFNQACGYHFAGDPHHIGAFFGAKGDKWHLKNAHLHGISTVPDLFILEAVVDGISRRIERRPLIQLNEIFNYEEDKKYFGGYRLDNEDTSGEGATYERFYRLAQKHLCQSKHAKQFFAE